ncbi:MAG: DEAD/DEAH box helicase [Candidatus Saccharimonadales bacterium]
MSYCKKQRSSKNGQNRGGSRGGNRGGARKTAYINPNKFVNKATINEQTAEIYQAKHRFADFPFSKILHENIYSKKYEVPSAIQDQAIPLIMEGKDVIGLANTGTGKTAAFLLPIIEKHSQNVEPFSVVILAPTRELAQQIDGQFRIFSTNLGMKSVLLVGGSNIDRQMAYLQRKPAVVIATPGRIMDLINRKKVPLNNVGTFVLDEADRMLDMGFVGDVRKIASLMPAQKQTLFFSATMTPRVEQLTKEFLVKAATISVVTASTSERVDQDIIEAYSKEDKMTTLLNLLQKSEFEKVLLFGKTKFGVQRLSERLCKQDIASVAIHGNKSQSQRQNALRQFATGKARVMVATDVAARGLDIPNVSHVINFDQPATYEDYVHRIGRTGRGSATGIALTFVDKY